MFDCDILITGSSDRVLDIWNVRPITSDGAKVFEHYFDTDADLPLGRRVAHVNTVLMRRIVRYGRHAKRDLTVAVIHMDDAIAEINARYLALKDEQKRIQNDASDLFEPLFKEAETAGDKRRLSILFSQYPDTVARSFLIMRWRDMFPELTQPGVTLDNWHEHEK